MVTQFIKAYGNTTGRRFYQFKVSDEQRERTIDIVYRRGYKEFEMMTKAQARKRAEYIFSMGDEIESMVQQLVHRYQKFGGEKEIKRCYQITVNVGLYKKWVEWLVKVKHLLSLTPDDPEWCLIEFIRQESSLWT